MLRYTDMDKTGGKRPTVCLQEDDMLIYKCIITRDMNPKEICERIYAYIAFAEEGPIELLVRMIHEEDDMKARIMPNQQAEIDRLTELVRKLAINYCFDAMGYQCNVCSAFAPDDCNGKPTELKHENGCLVKSMEAIDDKG